MEPGTEVRGEAAAADAQRALLEATGAEGLDELTRKVIRMHAFKIVATYALAVLFSGGFAGVIFVFTARPGLLGVGAVFIVMVGGAAAALPALAARGARRRTAKRSPDRRSGLN